MLPNPSSVAMLLAAAPYTPSAHSHTPLDHAGHAPWAPHKRSVIEWLIMLLKMARVRDIDHIVLIVVSAAAETWASIGVGEHGERIVLPW